MSNLLVLQKGVYNQGVWGVFDNLEEAKAFAKKLALLDDGYHTFEVEEVRKELPEVEVPVDNNTVLGKWKMVGDKWTWREPTEG